MTSQKQALIIIDHGSKVQQANDMVFDVVALISKKEPHLIVEGAHMELADPCINTAIDACVAQGATHIIAQPFMLSPGRHATRDIPSIVRKHAQQYPHVTIETGTHLGVHEKIADVLLERAFKRR